MIIPSIIGGFAWTKTFCLRERPATQGNSSFKLGIQPTTYEQFLRDFIAGRAGSGNSFAPPDILLVRMMNATMPLMMRLQLRFSERATQPQP